MISRLDIDTLRVHGPATTEYTLQEIEGLDAPEFRVSASEKPGEDGGIVTSAFYNSRLVTLTGIVSGASPAAYEQARRALAFVCRVRRDNTGFPVAVPVELETTGGETYTMDAFVKSFRITSTQQTFGKFLIVLLVPSPYLYGAELLSSGQISGPIGGGATWPVTWPMVFEVSSGGTVSIYQQGNADSHPLITFRDALTNPRIYSQERGKFMQLNTVMSTGDTVVIDMADKTIVKNGTSSLLTAKTSDSDWFSLVSGYNTLQFTTSSTSDTGTVEVTAKPAYLGL